MPELDGLDVVARLEVEAPDTAVVMISGYPSVERATEAMKGAMDYLPKPFRPEEISAAVKKAVNSKLTRDKRAIGIFEKMLEKFPTQESR